MNNKNLYDFMNDVIEYLEQCEQGISYDEFYANMMAIKEKHEITDFEAIAVISTINGYLETLRESTLA